MGDEPWHMKIRLHHWNKRCICGTIIFEINANVAFTFPMECYLKNSLV
jgi:hypothetical protein